MVVLAASIINKNGKALVSRQFVPMSRIRIEGLLAAFPKLVESGKQHTYVESENVRYVYQPMENLYLLLLTNKQSNILEDLETLTSLSKLVPEYCQAVEEEYVSKSGFEIIFAFDEVISLGHKEAVTVAQVKQILEMDSHEERMHKLLVESKINETKDVMKKKASEIDKSKLDKLRSDKSGIMNIPIRFDNGFNDITSSGGGSGNFSGNGFSSSIDTDSFSISKARSSSTSSTTNASVGKKGMQLGKGQKANQFLESLKAEGEVIVEDSLAGVTIAGNIPSSAAADGIAVSVEEKLVVALKKDGGLENIEVQGTLALVVHGKEDAQIRVQVETGANDGFQFKTHPNIDKDLYARENILGLRDSSRPFPTGTASILKWRMAGKDESLVPLNINCWPSVSGGETYVSIEYEASERFELQNVIISIPTPAHPTVNQVQGDWRYDARKSTIEWSIVLIDKSNKSGSMEFVVAKADPSQFFPIDVKFNATKTFCDIKVVSVNEIEGGNWNNVKYGGATQLIVDSYQVI